MHLLYNEEKTFKGNLFEESINDINKMHLGLGVKMSVTPYIYKDDNNKKSYLAAYCISLKKEIKTEINNEKKEEKIALKAVCNPLSYLYQVFHYKDFIFHLSQDNKLWLYHFKENKITKFTIPKIKDTSSKLSTEELKEGKIDIALKKIKGLNENVTPKETYEDIIDILDNDLNQNILVDNPKSFNGKAEFEFKIDEISYTFEIKLVKYEVDEAGSIKEIIQLEEGTIDFEKGINSLYHYVTTDKAKYSESNYTKNNTFKCPIIFKNFKEKEIKSNRAIICEIKGGFDIPLVKKQLTERIELLQNCFFNDDEKPEYYIGIVNLLSKNVEKISAFSKSKFKVKEKILIIATVDYIYMGINVSSEINTGYLLHKEMQNINKKLDKFDKLYDIIR